jgi:cytochrome c biogenesis protein ResB
MAQGIKWPNSDGSHLFRFQPFFSSIPYDVQLRRARQVSYPNSTQPYSYECDLIVYDKRRQTTSEETLSMNHVYETWDGYRFYLASLSPSDESKAKMVQLVVNLDPAKYFLTYPGGFVLSLGMLLLFFRRKTPS